jgi:hypothetical protein
MYDFFGDILERRKIDLTAFESLSEGLRSALKALSGLHQSHKQQSYWLAMLTTDKIARS